MQQDYAKAFRIIRAAFGLRQSELAERMSVSASQLSLIEAGKRQPSVRVINSLATAVGMPAALVSLLASSPNEMESTRDEDLSELRRSVEPAALWVEYHKPQFQPRVDQKLPNAKALFRHMIRHGILSQEEIFKFLCDRHDDDMRTFAAKLEAFLCRNQE